jgi:hypothetical protein
MVPSYVTINSSASATSTVTPLMAPSTKRTAVRKAASEASRKIRVQAGQGSGGQQKDQESSIPSISQVLKMEPFALLEIMDRDQIGVEEQVRVDDE